MSESASLRLVPQGDIAVLELDHANQKVNKLSTPFMREFKGVLEELSSSPYKALIIKSLKPKTFIVGADINEIQSVGQDKEEFEKIITEGQKIISLLEDLPMPTIAAVHGACAGGGCELILACDHRIATEAPETRIGLPETKLGIIPGFGGCVRLPRVVGLQAALDMILGGSLVRPVKALRLGLVDQVVHPSILRDQALLMARRLIDHGGGKRAKKFKPKGGGSFLLESFLGRWIVFSQARKKVMAQTQGHYPALLEVIDVIQKSFGKNREQALEMECRGFCAVAGNSVSSHLIDLFFTTEDVKKRNGLEKPRGENPQGAGEGNRRKQKGWDVEHMVVLGAGLMGGGIAYVAASKNIFVRIKDLNHHALSKALKTAHRLWQKKVQRKQITSYEFQNQMGHVRVGLDQAGFHRADVVVEAVVENMEVKKKVIQETCRHLKESCVFATNTSSLSVTEMAQAHPNPSQFVGMHFFSPVDRMPLVEVIRAPQTSDQATVTIYKLAQKMGKIPIVVKDSPGFLVNRLLVGYMMEALFYLQEGASIERVDSVFVKSFGMPMGPYALMDSVGLDVCSKVCRIFSKNLGPRMCLPEKMIDSIDELGFYGVKSLKGFYLYEQGSSKKRVHSSVYKQLGVSPSQKVLDEQEIIERGLFRMINEAALVLEEQVVSTASDLDLAMIMGIGFPPFRGGPLKWADEKGIGVIVEKMRKYAQRNQGLQEGSINYGLRFEPSSPLEVMAESQLRFHQKYI